MTKEQIKEWNKAYRSGDALISDEEYDIALAELKSELGWFEYESFIETLTEGVDDNSKTITLPYVLGSLTKYKHEEPEKYIKWKKDQNGTKQIISDKIDGCSFFASYREGKLVTLASRGDGTKGTDWTDKAPYINIPQTIESTLPLDIRGEVTLIGNNHVVLGLKNKRNGTAGIMNSKEVDPSKLQYIHAYAYEVLSGDYDMLAQFKHLVWIGFEVANYIVIGDMSVEDLVEYYNTRRSHASYDIDGLVISNVEYKSENEFYPTGKIAFKINSEGITTTVKGIEWNLSKGGLLKPVVLLEAVEIDGTTVQRATGNNYKFVLENGIGAGAVVSVLKSGQIIPKIVKVITKSFGSNDTPVFCPSCNTSLSYIGVDLKCTNEECGHVLVKSLASFLIKAGVEGATATSLINWNINTFEDLINWKPSSNKSEKSFYGELTKKIFTKHKEELFACMVFDGAGETNINKLLDFYGEGKLVTATKVLYVSATDLFFEMTGYPEGIGQKIIDKIKDDWFINIKNVALITSDERYAPKVKVAPVVIDNTNITGKSFLFTGTLKYKRSVAERYVEEHGGFIASSVSKNLAYLISGQDQWGSSTKFTKAEKLGVPILNEEQFLELIGEQW